MTDNSSSRIGADKLETRLQEWASPLGVQFANIETECAYKARVKLFQDALQLRKPSRVPIHLHTGFYPIRYAGFTAQEAMNDYAKLGQAMIKFNADFLPDSLASAMVTGPAPVFEALDLRLYQWPGHGVPSDAPFQCLESEYMHDDEYDLLIADPTNFFLRYFLPRIFGALDAWEKISPLTDLTELPFMGGNLVALGQPDVQAAFEKYLQAGRAALEWVKACGAINSTSVCSLGLVPFTAGFTKAPFDTLGDTLRGTRGIMLDKFRRPAQVLAAVERLVPIAVEMGVRLANSGHKPIITIPLHKGADGFISVKDFQTYYWPSLKATILGLVGQGVIPLLFVEGSYNDQRLDIIADSGIPAGTTLWMFDKTDLRQVKKRFGSWACFAGNVPVSLLATGAENEVCDYVRRLIDDVAQDGGFIISTGAVLDDARAENLHAMIETARDYGVYH